MTTCSTCVHEMQDIGPIITFSNGIAPRRVAYWCPRCGSLKVTGQPPDIAIPTFLKTITANLVNADDTTPRDEPGPLCGPLWAKVGHLFGLGSSSAQSLCYAIGLTPDEGRFYE